MTSPELIAELAISSRLTPAVENMCSPVGSCPTGRALFMITAPPPDTWHKFQRILAQITAEQAALLE